MSKKGWIITGIVLTAAFLAGIIAGIMDIGKTWGEVYLEDFDDFVC